MGGYLDPAQVGLGRLVLNMKNPGQNFCPHAVLNLCEGDVSNASFSNLKALSNAESSSHFTASLSKLFSIFAKKSNTTVDDISTKKAIRRQLLNVSLKFESLFDNKEVKKWIEKIIPTGNSIYMVVGFDTLQDASVSLNRDTSTDAGGKIQAPITDGLAPGASALPVVGDALDLQVEGGRTSKQSTGASFIADGERIVAVQYQKVVIQMSSSKDTKTVQGAGLAKKTVWKSFGVARGTTNLDTFEATLAQGATAEDVEEDVDIEAASNGPEGLFVILDY